MPESHDPHDRMIGIGGQLTLTEPDILPDSSEFVVGGDAATEGITEKAIPQWRLAARKFRRHKVAFISLIVFTIIVLAVLFAGVIAPYGETEQHLDDAFQSPNSTYWLGTDSLGRDVFSRILYGGRVSIAVGIAVALITGVLGTLVGLVAGFYGRAIDTVLMRLTDTMLAFPALVFLIMASRILGDGIWDVVVAISLIAWMALARIVRGQVLALKEREFVEAARSMGASNFRIMGRHLLPNLVGPITVTVSLTVAAAILLETTLSFLGLGVSPVHAATWGNLLAGSEGFIQTASWLVIWPSLAIVVTVLCINFLGDGLRDALDPTQGKT